MNIYLINEDGETFCIRAKTMSEAINVCEVSYLDSIKMVKIKIDEENYNEDNEKEYYHVHILQSCSLVGELKN